MTHPRPQISWDQPLSRIIFTSGRLNDAVAQARELESRPYKVRVAQRVGNGYAQRDKAIVDAFLAYVPVTQIAEAAGLSRGRVHEIIKNYEEEA